MINVLFKDRPGLLFKAVPSPLWGITILAFGLGSTPTPSEARPHRISQIPNNSSCSTCHGGYPPSNPFGRDAWRTFSPNLTRNSSGNVVWADLYHLDSDGDGVTNGEELGDPHGRWRIGGTPQFSYKSDPGRANSVPFNCGNESVDFGEECDGALLDEETCETQGFVSGTLGCRQGCSFDFAECETCGDGVIDADRGEECDGETIGGATCQQQGFFTGTLSCGDQCSFDVSQCNNCGDGVLNANEGELCDGESIGQATCVSIGQGFLDGELGCAPNGCGAYDVSRCLNCLDLDDDFICDDIDTCPTLSNPDQLDLDQDGIGDVCDEDLDGDGLNNDQEDLDLDGVVDLGETDPRNEDTDGDQVNDALDNCPLLPNEEQGDLDNDQLGDLCDDDIDGDLLTNDVELTLGSDPRDADSDDDTIEDGVDNCLFEDKFTCIYVYQSN